MKESLKIPFLCLAFRTYYALDCSPQTSTVPPLIVEAKLQCYSFPFFSLGNLSVCSLYLFQSLWYSVPFSHSYIIIHTTQQTNTKAFLVPLNKRPISTLWCWSVMENPHGILKTSLPGGTIVLWVPRVTKKSRRPDNWSRRRASMRILLSPRFCNVRSAPCGMSWNSRIKCGFPSRRHGSW